MALDYSKRTSQELRIPPIPAQHEGIEEFRLLGGARATAAPREDTAAALRINEELHEMIRDAKTEGALGKVNLVPEPEDADSGGS